MKKRKIVILLSALLICLGVLNCIGKNIQKSRGPTNYAHKKTTAIWISCYDYNFSGLSLKEFEEKTNKMFDKIKKANINTVFFHVRAFADSIYDSDYFPYSDNVLSEDGTPPEYDVLNGLISAAHKRGIAFHAWINPYRISTVNDSLSERFLGTPVEKLDKEDENSILTYDGGLYFNPASVAARKLIADGVREITDIYDVDGIQFDDYFYPTTDSKFDAKSYKCYTDSGGKLSLDDWRRANVNILISEVYAAVKAKDKQKLFGISPSGNLDENYKSFYADVKKWMTSEGFIDYICPQIYYGFENPDFPFDDIADDWTTIKRDKSVDIFVGLAGYKVGKTDKYAAGEKAKKEWTDSGNLLCRQADYCMKGGKYSGIAIFSYKSFFSDECESERNNLCKFISQYMRS